MNILVTGGAGLIGSNLVKALTKKKFDTYVVDNLWRGKLENLKENNDFFIDIKNNFYNKDLNNYNNCLEVTKNIDTVIHLADIVAGINFVFGNEAFVFRQNLLINSNIIKAAIENNIKNFLYIGTACSYPLEKQMEIGSKPLLEDEVYPANPESGYGWSKLMGEYELTLAGNLSNMNTGILRLHNVYGPPCEVSEERSQVIPSLARKLILDEDFIVWGSGSQRRAFLYIDDVIDGILKYLKQGFGHGCIQLSPYESTSIADIANKLVKISNKKVNVKFDTTKPEGDKDRTGNIEKAKKILEWSPETTIDDGLEKTYRWIEKYLLG